MPGSTAPRMAQAPPSTVAGAPPADLALGVLLSGFVVFLVLRVNPQPVVLAEVAAVAMVLPVAWRRRAPLAVAAFVAAAAVGNGLFIGSLTRCGAAFPAVLLVAYAAGVRAPLKVAVAALVLCMVDLAAQAQWDPKLEGLSALAVLAPMTGAVWAVGLVVRSRTALAATLRERAATLRASRDRTAAVAVAADRARVADELGPLLHGRVDELATLARRGRDGAEADPGGVRDALGAIETSGRDTLDQMRSVVGSLRAGAPTEPQPTLAELRALLARATSAEATLTVVGDQRALPAGIELTAYRVVEHLLAGLDDAPRARIDVRVEFASDALEVSVSGPSRRAAELSAGLAGVRERVALHGGRVRTRALAHGIETSVRLPLVSAHS